ncbi:MAG: dockerin type I domain-containing protein [Ruminococcus sp.]|nr:dockerin type I domain-containing protein [Ruminococcus sp.]
MEWGLNFNPLDKNIAYGDLNADNSIDIADAVLMYSYISGHEIAVGFEADLTKDGIIDAFDMAAMRRNLIA